MAGGEAFRPHPKRRILMFVAIGLIFVAGSVILVSKPNREVVRASSSSSRTTKSGGSRDQARFRARQPPSGGAGGIFQCPEDINIRSSVERHRIKFNDLRDSYGDDTKLLSYSFYNMELSEWDLILRTHTSRLGYKPGELIFESGMAAGATLDSLQRQYGVRIAGVDFADNLIALASRRLNGTFCAGDARDLSFIPDNMFDHTVAFAVFMYLDFPPDFCNAAKEMIRVTKPGGTIFIGQVNDGDRKHLRHPNAEGTAVLGGDYWYRFASKIGLKDVRVLRGSEVYSARTIPNITTYDLHAQVRYNVYFRKPLQGLDLDGMNCNSVVSHTVEPRTTVGGKACYLPFEYRGTHFDDCTNIDGNGEWCPLQPKLEYGEDNAENRGTVWDYCAPTVLEPGPLFSD